jgi:hypothetical protein
MDNVQNFYSYECIVNFTSIPCTEVPEGKGHSSAPRNSCLVSEESQDLMNNQTMLFAEHDKPYIVVLPLERPF